jgi:hypothetical protein
VNVLSILISLLFTALYNTAAQFRCVIFDRFHKQIWDKGFGRKKEY